MKVTAKNKTGKGTLSKDPKEAKPVKQESGREFHAEGADAQSRSVSGVPRGQWGRNGVWDGEVGNEAENRAGGKGLQTSRKASTAATLWTYPWNC